MSTLQKPGVRRKSSAMLLSASGGGGGGGSGGADARRPSVSNNFYNDFGSPQDEREFLLDDRSDSLSLAPSMSSAAASAYSAAGGGYGLSNPPPTNGSGGGGVQGSTIDTLRFIAQKRVTTFVYLKKAHEGRVHWFNTVLLSKQDLDAGFEPAKMQQRTMRFAVLGMSLSSLLDITTANDFLRGLLNLLQEYELIQDANFKPKMRALFKQSKGPRKSGTTADYSLNLQDASESSYLFSPNVPFDLDYFQVLYTLCDMLVEIYQKILGLLTPTTSPNASSATLNVPFPPPPRAGAPATSALTSAGADMVIKIDVRLKRIIAVITKELDAIARNAIKDELSQLDPMLGGFSGADTGQEGSFFAD